MDIKFDTIVKIHDAIQIIESGQIEGLELGHYDLAEGISVNVMEYETKNEGIFESHRRNIDIHYPMTGSEQIEIIDELDLDVVEPYNPEGDYLLGNGKGKRYKVEEKHCFVVMPGEAHCPGLSAAQPMKIKKAVIKVKIS